MVNGAKVPGLCIEPVLWCETITEIFHCNGKLVREIKRGNRFSGSRGGSGPAFRNGIGGIPSGLGPRDGLSHFMNAMIPAMSNEIEDNQVEASKGWISEGDRLSLREAKYALNASAISTGDSMHKVLNTMNFGVGCERALKMWKACRTGLGDPEADISRLLSLI